MSADSAVTISVTSPVSQSITGAGGAVAPSGPLLYDTFTDANGTDLSAHTPDTDSVGDGWVDDTNPVEIQNNKACGGAFSNCRSRKDVGVSDMTINAERTTGPSNSRSAWLMSRLSDFNNCLFVNCDLSSVRIYKREAGVNTLLASGGAVSLSGDSTYPAQFVLSGASLTASYAGSEAATTNSFNQTETEVGLHFDRYPAADGGYVDNIEVTQ